MLREALASLPAAAKARWAGTLSSIEWPQGKGHFDPVHSAEALPASDLLCELCEAALAAIYWGEESAQPEILIGLYRAGRRIMQPSAGVSESRARSVCNQIHDSVTDEMFWKAVRQEVMSGYNQAAYHANELVHARVGFEDVLRDGLPRQVYDRIEGIYVRAHRLLAASGLTLDAGNWLRRSNYVWIPKNKNQQVAALAKRAEYLANAKRCLKDNADSQGTWSKQVDRAVQRFLRKNPSFEGDLAEPV